MPLKSTNTTGGSSDIDAAIEKKKEDSKEDSQDPFIAAAKGKELGEEPVEKEKTPEEEEHEAAINTPQAVLNDPTASSRSVAVARAQQSKINATNAEEEDNTEANTERNNPPGFEPIEASDVIEELPNASSDTFVGKSDLAQKQGSQELEEFNTDIKKLAELVADSKAKGEKAPNINLCKVSIPGTNLYCDNNLGIPRDQMPQFKGKPVEGSEASKMPLDASGEVDTEPVFKQMLKRKNIKTVQTEIPADKLKATQSELVGAKVVGMMGALEKDPNHPAITAPIYVSRDGYVIDGHHRWAAVVAYNAKNPNAQIPMRVTVIDMDIKDAIPMANKFAEDIGVAVKKADANKEAPATTSKPEEKPEPKYPMTDVPKAETPAPPAPKISTEEPKSEIDKENDAYGKGKPSGVKPKEEPAVTDDEIGTKAKTKGGKTLYHIGGGYYSDSPNGVAKYIRVESLVEKIIETDSKKWWNLLFEADVKANVENGKEGTFREIPKSQQDPATIQADIAQNAQTKAGKVKKDKKLDQSKNTSDEFNVGTLSKDGVSDSTFKSNKKIKPTPAQIKRSYVEKFFLDENGKSKFPKKYVKVLTRLLNTKPAGVTIRDFTDASGAGTLASTMGELLTMMAVTMKDDSKSNEFFNTIQSHVKENGKDSIIDVGWVKSAQKVRDSLYKRYDRIYGKGNWELEQMAWDVPSEVEALGLENYKQNKGFSTDVYAKVKVNGKSVLDEISLKKELTANLLNATSNRIQDIMVRGAASEDDLKMYDDLNSKIDSLAGLKDKSSIEEKRNLVAQRDAIIEKYNAKVPDQVKVSYAQKKQREFHQYFIKNGQKEAMKFLNKFCSKDTKYRKISATTIKTKLNQKEDYIKQVTKKIDALCKEVKSGKSYADALIGLEKADYQKLNLSIMAAIAAEDSKSIAAKAYNDIIQNSHNHSKAVRDFLLKDTNARKGLFASIREALPLKALFEGEENMILGDVSADKQVLQDVFGVSTFEELEEKLAIRDTPPPPSIVYRVVGKEDIPVAEISSRPNGIGYSSTWKLEMGVHPDFGKKLRESNLKLNAPLSENYSESIKKKILERLISLREK
jgi:hypothetical protein